MNGCITRMDEYDRQQRKEKKRLLVQKQLELALHAEKCIYTRGECGLEKCTETKKILDHIQHCTDGKTCIVKHCSSTKSGLDHWRSCKQRSCSICQPLRDKALEEGSDPSNTLSSPYQTVLLTEREPNHTTHHSSRKMGDTKRSDDGQADTVSGILGRLERIEKTLFRADDKYLSYIKAIDSKLTLLQKNSVERNKSVMRLENTLLDFEKKFAIFETVFQNAVKSTKDSIASAKESAQDSILGHVLDLDKKTSGEIPSRIKDCESGNESDILSELSTEDDASELDFQNSITNGQQNGVGNKHDHVSVRNLAPGRLSFNNERDSPDIGSSVNYPDDRSLLGNRSVKRDEFGFKRLRSDSKFDNRTVLYQELSCASARTIVERKSRMVDESIANVKRKQPEESTKKSVPKSTPTEYTPTAEKEDLFSRLKYESVDDLKSQMLEQMPDSETWTALANAEANQGHSGKRVPRGKGPDTCILLDISDSMSGRPFVQMIEAAKTIIMGIAVVAASTPIEENIAIATFGHECRVLQHLTNEYTSVINQLDYLVTGGHTPMTAGLLMGLAGCLGNGAGVHMAGRKLVPRIILLTDGKATVDSTVPMEDKTASTVQEALIRPFMLAVCTDLRQRGIKVYWVPIGDSVDSSFPKTIISATSGKMIPVTELDRIVQTTQMKMLASGILSRYPDLGPNVSTDTLKMLAGNESLVVPNYEDLKSFVEEFQNVPDDLVSIPGTLGGAKHEEFNPNLPPIGTRVRRGPTWHYKFQDGEGPGTVVGHDRDGRVWVEWDNTHINVYHYNFTAYDVKIVNEPRKLLPGELIATGCLVRRGPDWKRGDEDGGAGNLGAVFTAREDGLLGVRWPNKNLGFYKFGQGGKLEVIHVDPDNVNEDDIQSNKASLNNPSEENNTVRPKKTIKNEDVIDNLNRKNEEKMKERDQEFSGVWEYEVENDVWQPYPGDICEKLEKAYRRSKKGLPIIEINGEIYRVVFSKWLQINQKTNDQARVRRKGSE